MKKSDLEYGNVIETRMGGKYLFNFNKGDQFLNLITGDSYLQLSDFNEDLTNCCNIFDIMKVYKDYTCKELLWERKETPKLTEDEKVILRNLPKDYKWITRDKNGWIYLFTHKPIKIIKNTLSEWDGLGFTKLIFPHLFQFIKWEDEEPYSIEELLEGEE